MTTPETITGLVEQGESLSKRLPLVKTEQSKENVEAYQTEIDRFRNKLKRHKHEHQRKVDELRAEMRLLSMLEDTLKTDQAEAKNHMFLLIQERKEANFGRSPSNQ